MRCLERNKRAVWLSSFSTKEVEDEAGLGTGEYIQAWSEPVAIRINVSAPSGSADSSPFGTAVDYDLVAVSDSNPWGMGEGDRVWLSSSAPDPSDTSDAYVVSRVSESINFVSFGLRRAQGA